MCYTVGATQLYICEEWYKLGMLYLLFPILRGSCVAAIGDTMQGVSSVEGTLFFVHKIQQPAK